MLDGGDVFYERYQEPAGDRAELDARARLIVDQYNRLGTRAITLGDRDLLLGVEALKALHARAKFPFLVANLVDPARGEPLFEAHTVVDAAGVKVGIFGVTLAGAERPGPDGGPAAWRIDDPLAAAAREVAALKREGAGVIVALAHLPEADMRRLGEEVPGIDFVLGGQGVRTLDHPEAAGRAFAVDGGTKGKFLAVLTLHLWKDRPATGPFADRFKEAGLETRIQQLDTRIATYERILEAKQAEADQAAADGSDAGAAGASPRAARSRATTVEFYKNQLVRMRAERQALEMDLEAAETADASANYFRYELLPVRKDLADEPAIGKDVTAFLERFPKQDPHAIRRPPTAPPRRPAATPQVPRRPLATPPSGPVRGPAPPPPTR